MTGLRNVLNKNTIKLSFTTLALIHARVLVEGKLYYWHTVWLLSFKVSFDQFHVSSQALLLDIIILLGKR